MTTTEFHLEDPQHALKSDYKEQYNTQYTLASYASDPLKSRGRLIEEEGAGNRSPFRRDCDRIIHSAAFRRLEYKTQVFVNHEGDHYRTRLTHSLEVAQIARSVCRNLGLNEDLSEALALAHDLGHTPFGHAGEEALNDITKGLYRFNHNAHSLKLVTELEKRYAAFDGMNLSWEVIEGIAKHNGPLVGPHASKLEPIPEVIDRLNQQFSLELDQYPSAEAQIAAAADDIAYNNHDIDDGLRAGLFTIKQLKEVPMIANMFREMETQYPSIPESRMIHEVIRRLINRMIVDLTRQTVRNIKESGVKTPEDIRKLGTPVVQFSKNMQQNMAAIKTFLYEHMYRHYKVCRMTSKARRVVQELYTLFFDQPECLPTEWRFKATNVSEAKKSEIVADFIAGMTDRFATDEHRRLFDIEARY